MVVVGKILDIEFIVKGIWKGFGNCNNEGNFGYENCVNIVFVVLEVGDIVNVWFIIGNYVYGYVWLSFKGWRNWWL